MLLKIVIMMSFHNKYILIISIISLLACSCEEEEPLPTVSYPEIDSFSPVSGQEGTQVVINGYNFNSNINQNTIFIGDATIKPLSANFKQLTFIVPAGIPPGEYKIKVHVDTLTTISSQYFEVKEEVNITDPEVLSYNYIIGTQTVGPSYGFTDEDVLVETSRAILEMGSN